MKNVTPWINTPDEAINQTFDYILNHWSSLTCSGKDLYFPLPYRFVRPGGFFEMFFYWDSYFAILGLVIQGEWQLAKEILDNLIYEIEELGHVPNYNGPKTICKSRSQPPCLTLAIKEVYPYIKDESWLERALNAANQEYSNYWMVEPHLTDTGLNRYIDTDENGCSTIPDTSHYRGIAESGWDNTPRFGDDITSILPVDLNCLLYQYEVDMALFHRFLGNKAESTVWSTRAQRRKKLIDYYFWDREAKFYRDYNFTNGGFIQNVPLSLASFLPLWAKIPNKSQAEECFKKLSLFEEKYGLSTCVDGFSNNTQWNYSVGWAPLHWFTIIGLRNYSFDDDVTRITMKWLGLIAEKYVETGVIREKYNVVNPDARLPGRYGPQRGFAWTNGVFVALLIRVILGLDYELLEIRSRWKRNSPSHWANKKIEWQLPNYPWPKGSNS
jgi:alpha,alpha-trehalase